MSRSDTRTFLQRLLGQPAPPLPPRPEGPAGRVQPPTYSISEREPVPLTTVRHPDGRMSQYPPPETWDDWVEWDARAWPKKVPRRGFATRQSPGRDSPKWRPPGTTSTRRAPTRAW